MNRTVMHVVCLIASLAHAHRPANGEEVNPSWPKRYHACLKSMPGWSPNADFIRRTHFAGANPAENVDSAIRFLNESPSIWMGDRISGMRLAFVTSTGVILINHPKEALADEYVDPSDSFLSRHYRLRITDPLGLVPDLYIESALTESYSAKNEGLNISATLTELRLAHSSDPEQAIEVEMECRVNATTRLELRDAIIKTLNDVSYRYDEHQWHIRNLNSFPNYSPKKDVNGDYEIWENSLEKIQAMFPKEGDPIDESIRETVASVLGAFKARRK